MGDTKTRSTLSEAASAVARYLKGSYEAEQLDALFDGGEFSGPDHYKARHDEVPLILMGKGWTTAEFEAELEARTTPKWTRLSDLIGWTPEAYAQSLWDI